MHKSTPCHLNNSETRFDYRPTPRRKGTGSLTFNIRIKVVSTFSRNDCSCRCLMSSGFKFKLLRTDAFANYLQKLITLGSRPATNHFNCAGMKLKVDRAHSLLEPLFFFFPGPLNVWRTRCPRDCIDLPGCINLSMQSGCAL